MSNLYIITYNLDSSRDHTSLYNAIKNYTWWHYLDNTWIVKTSDSAGTIYSKISPFIDKEGEHLLIMKIDPATGNKQGWLPKKAWDWINKNKD